VSKYVVKGEWKYTMRSIVPWSGVVSEKKILAPLLKKFAAF
jgi:hypothetical protein